MEKHTVTTVVKNANWDWSEIFFSRSYGYYESDKDDIIYVE